jgi:hypothetical protein
MILGTLTASEPYTQLTQSEQAQVNQQVSESIATLSQVVQSEFPGTFINYQPSSHAPAQAQTP